MSCTAVWFDFMPMEAVVITAAIGLLAVFTSVMIYVDTHRPFWNLGLTAGKFFGSSLVLGSAGVAVLSQSTSMIVLSLVARAALLAWEQAKLRGALYDDASPWQLSARVIKYRLAHVGLWKESLFLFSLVFGVGALTSEGVVATAWTLGLFLSALTGQVLERYTFFVAAMGPRMTGGYQP